MSADGYLLWLWGGHPFFLSHMAIWHCTVFSHCKDTRIITLPLFGERCKTLPVFLEGLWSWESIVLIIRKVFSKSQCSLLPLEKDWGVCKMPPKMPYFSFVFVSVPETQVKSPAECIGSSRSAAPAPCKNFWGHLWLLSCSLAQRELLQQQGYWLSWNQFAFPMASTFIHRMMEWFSWCMAFGPMALRPGFFIQ